MNTGSNTTVFEYCETNSILPLYRAQLGEFSFSYDRERDLLVPVAGNQDPTRAANTGRITTYARAGSENAHTLKNQYKYLGHRAHNSRLVAVGRAKTAKYAAKYNSVQSMRLQNCQS